MKADINDHGRIGRVFAVAGPDIIIDMNPQLIAFDVQVPPSVCRELRKDVFAFGPFR